MKVLRVLLVLAVFLFVSEPAFGDEKEIINVPPPVEGARWEFRATTKDAISSSSDRLDGNYEIVYRGGSLDVHQIIDGQRVEVGLQSAETLKRMVAFGQDERKYLEFPLLVGKKWSAEYYSQAPGAQSRTRNSVDYKVEGKEEISTAARKLPALRIKGEGRGTRASYAWSTESVYHYSPTCRCIAKYYYDSAVGQRSAKIEIELINFSLPGQDAVKAR